MASDSLFRQKAPGIMALLMQDFALDEESAAAILGNLGHESGGFRDLQEKKPMIPGSRGGWGWAQWTGARRTAFEAYCQRNGYDPAGDTAQYKWLYLELSGKVGSEGRAIPAVKNAVGLNAKVKAFELAFERAADEYKAYESRNQWAEKALAVYRAGGWSPLQIVDAPHAPGTTEVLPRAPQLDPNALAPLINTLLPVLLQLLASRTQQPGQQQPDLGAMLGPLLAGLAGAPPPLQLPPPAPQPPAPEPIVVTPPAAPSAIEKPSVGIGLLGLFGSLIGMATGQVGTPFGMGAEPTTAGTLSVLIPAAVSMVGATGIFGPFGALAGRMLSAAFTAARAPK